MALNGQIHRSYVDKRAITSLQFMTFSRNFTCIITSWSYNISIISLGKYIYCLLRYSWEHGTIQRHLGNPRSITPLLLKPSWRNFIKDNGRVFTVKHTATWTWILSSKFSYSRHKLNKIISLNHSFKSPTFPKSLHQYITANKQKKTQIF